MRTGERAREPRAIATWRAAGAEAKPSRILRPKTRMSLFPTAVAEPLRARYKRRRTLMGADYTVSRANRYAFPLALAAVALVLRLFFVLVLEPNPNLSGGDANWYMRTGRDLVTTGVTDGPMQPPPLYPILLGVVQVLIPGSPASGTYYTHAELQTVRVLQSVLGALLCVLVYLWGRRLFGERAGRLAGGVLAVSPALIVDVGHVASENLMLPLFFGGLALYAHRTERPTARHMVAVGVLFGLATMTRAAVLAFPLLLVVHLFLQARAHWRRLTLALLLSYSAVVSTWTVYNVLVWDRVVIGGEGILAFMYQGTRGQLSPHELDSELGVSRENDRQDRAQKLKEQVERTVLGDPLGWATYRAKQLAQAYAQPHNTNHFGGPSIRRSAWDWLRTDRSLAGLRALTRTRSFWPKLVLYIFHYAGLGLGVLGMVAERRRWRALLPLYGVVLYFTALHFVLLALPRYLFPTYPAYWLFGAAWLTRRVYSAASTR